MLKSLVTNFQLGVFFFQTSEKNEILFVNDRKNLIQIKNGHLINFYVQIFTMAT